MEDRDGSPLSGGFYIVSNEEWQVRSFVWGQLLSLDGIEEKIAEGCKFSTWHLAKNIWNKFKGEAIPEGYLEPKIKEIADCQWRGFCGAREALVEAVEPLGFEWEVEDGSFSIVFSPTIRIGVSNFCLSPKKLENVLEILKGHQEFIETNNLSLLDNKIEVKFETSGFISLRLKGKMWNRLDYDFWDATPSSAIEQRAKILKQLNNFSLTQELEELKKKPQTPKVKSRIQEIKNELGDRKTQPKTPFCLG